MGGAPITRTWRKVAVDPDTADMLDAAAAVLDPEGIRLTGIPGYGSYRDNDASGGTDNGGGHADLYLIGYTDAQCRRAETVVRSKGGSAFFRPERRPDGTRYGWARHLHVLRMDAPDLSPGARTQIGDYLAGWNGLPVGGRITRDTGSRAYLDRRWLSIRTQEDDMPTPGELWGYKAGVTDDTGKKIDAWQVLADARTSAMQAVAQVAALTSALKALADQPDLSLEQITAAAKAGAQAALDEKITSATTVLEVKP